jgi:citrate synthase
MNNLSSLDTGAENGVKEKKNTLTVTDNRTGKTIELKIDNDFVINATDLKKLTLDKDDKQGIMVFDPAFMNTAVATSKITYVDGEKGELRYRGYRIEDLVANCSFLEVAFLLIYGELPTSKQFQDWENKVMTHTYIHENLISQMKTFRYDAHPMGMLISSVAALSTFYEEANPALKGPMLYKNQNLRNKQIFNFGKITNYCCLRLQTSNWTSL